MDFLNELFDVLKFTKEQKVMAEIDLDCIIKAKTSSNLIIQLPDNLGEKINITSNDDPTAEKQRISILVKQYFSREKIHDTQQFVIGEVFFSYLKYMLAEASIEEKKQIKRLLTKYDLRI